MQNLKTPRPSSSYRFSLYESRPTKYVGDDRVLLLLCLGHHQLPVSTAADGSAHMHMYLQLAVLQFAPTPSQWATA